MEEIQIAALVMICGKFAELLCRTETKPNVTIGRAWVKHKLYNAYNVSYMLTANA